MPAIASPGNDETGQKIEHLLAHMTLEEKIGQMSQIPANWTGDTPQNIAADIRSGRVGSVLNAKTARQKNLLQKIAVEESRLGIPIVFGRDVIHGFATIYPIPLGQAASWNPALVEQAARFSAVEAAATGIRWTFAPMIDVARDPRWGRIAESFGEDPWLVSLLGAACVRGFQGGDPSAPSAVAACAKHFAGYGAALGGRDYNTTWIPEVQLRDVYLPPFKAAVDAGVLTFMSSFNDINGVPSTGSTFLLRDILRNEWSFDGLVASDWDSVVEMITHGFCAGKAEAAEAALAAGLDMEIASDCYRQNLARLLKDGRVTMQMVDDATRRVLRLKHRLGLFETPCAVDDGDARRVLFAKPHLDTARELALQSVVMLKNENRTLPLPGNIKRLAVIGPLADAPRDQLGCWVMDAEPESTVTPLAAIKASGLWEVEYAPGLPSPRSPDRGLFADAVEKARRADAVVIFAGEDAMISGESKSRAFINLPGAQEELVRAVAAVAGKPPVLVIMAGRPLVFHRAAGCSGAILYAWHPGTMGGPALCDLLAGKRSPSGRLTVSFPRSEGQIPVYYAAKKTGRPPSATSLGIPLGTPLDPKAFSSRYIDVDFTPAYPFGYGLAYSTVEYSQPVIAAGTGRVTVSARITNTGDFETDEVAQLYIRDVVASLIRPVRELKGFQKITLKPGETRTVAFELSASDLSFHNPEGKPVCEDGWFDVWIAPDAVSGEKASFYRQGSNYTAGVPPVDGAKRRPMLASIQATSLFN
jgi:beta-glucosidase